MKKLNRLVKLNEDFPTIGDTVEIKNVDYEMVDYFKRTNRELIVTLKDNTKVKSSVGTIFNDLCFFGKFPKEYEDTVYSIQIKNFKSIEIVG